jgi:hypothetical protein
MVLLRVIFRVSKKQSLLNNVKHAKYGILEHFHFENALSTDSVSVGCAHEEQAKLVFAEGDECGVSKLICSRAISL